MTTGAIILAAGSSQRMRGSDKLLQPLDGRPLVAFSIAAFAASKLVDELAVVVSRSNHDAIETIAGQLAPRARVVLGGERRQDSVRAGLEALAEADYIVVHDGARPLVSNEMIEAALHGAIETGAAVCAVALTDTLKRGDSAGLVSETVPRQNLWLAQTPQAFRRQLLLRAHVSYGGEATDDAAMVEQLGKPVRLVQGSPRNLKVTSPEDLQLAEALLHRSRVGEG